MRLHMPRDLMDQHMIHELFHFLNPNVIVNEVTHPRHQNRTPGNLTVIGDEELLQCREIVKKIPARSLNIFRHAPYSGCHWSRLLEK
ncbi:MAG: hypothetical protein WAO76_08420 [Georgfuchsia sp.]